MIPSAGIWISGLSVRDLIQYRCFVASTFRRTLQKNLKSQLIFLSVEIPYQCHRNGRKIGEAETHKEVHCAVKYLRFLYVSLYVAAFSHQQNRKLFSFTEPTECTYNIHNSTVTYRPPPPPTDIFRHFFAKFGEFLHQIFGTI